MEEVKPKKKAIMHLTILLISFILTINFSHANNIDSLNTLENVQKFLKKKNRKWKEHSDYGLIKNPAQYEINNFFKLDLDNNGLTDLLIEGTYLFAIMDKDNGHYSCVFMDNEYNYWRKRTLIDIFHENETPLLIVKSFCVGFMGERTDYLKTDTLIFNHDAFYEYNQIPNNVKIKKIEFTSYPQDFYSTFFEITINSDRTALYSVSKPEWTGWKYFTATIDTESYNKILQAVNHITLPASYTSYEGCYRDYHKVSLQIQFDFHKRFDVMDIGADGTFGLRIIYCQLNKLIETQRWKEINNKSKEWWQFWKRNKKTPQQGL